MMSNKTIKILGIVATVGMAALTMLNAYVDDKKLDERIDERIKERELLISNEEEEA